MDIDCTRCLHHDFDTDKARKCDRCAGWMLPCDLLVAWDKYKAYEKALIKEHSYYTYHHDYCIIPKGQKGHITKLFGIMLSLCDKHSLDRNAVTFELSNYAQEIP